MMKYRKLLAGLVLSGLWVFFVAGSAHALPRIQMLATGGTIAGAQADTMESGYKAGTFSIEYLINAREL